MAKQTVIYWLLDRTGKGLHGGRPFYCGKTRCGVAVRLRQHLSAANPLSTLPVSQRIMSAGRSNVRAIVVETVPPDFDWVVREKYWTGRLHAEFPDSVNVLNRRATSPMTLEQREAIRKSNLGRIVGARTKSRLRKAAARRDYYVRRRKREQRQARAAIRKYVLARIKLLTVCATLLR